MFVDDLLWLDRIQAENRLYVGEKAFYLSQLWQKGYPVIPGFAIAAPTLRQFLQTIEWIDPLFADLPSSSLYVDVDKARQLQQVAQRIRREIMAAVLPATWESKLLAASRQLQAQTLILRPSLALPSYDGVDGIDKISRLLESHVCACTEDALAAAVKRVWAELFRARCLLYWQRAGIKLQQIHLAILVQPIYNARASGTVLANSQWHLHATWGLGMALVRGEVVGDYYQVQPSSGVTVRRLGNKTIAYRVSEANLAVAAPLETYFLSEEEQQQYALEENYLNELIALTHRLSAEFNPNLILEWTLVQRQDLTPQLYITQVYPRLPERGNSPNREHSQAEHTPQSQTQNAIMRGLGASSGRVMAKAQVVSGRIENSHQLPPGRILVAPSVTPDLLPLLQRAAGVVAELGGMTSHGAIVARELGIPAVVGVRFATNMIQTGDLIMVDGDRGEIHRVAEERGNAEFSAKTPQITPNFTPLATQLLVNLNQSSAIETAKTLPIDGVGLLRSEIMMLEILAGQHPRLWIEQKRSGALIERLSEHIILFASAFAPRPVFYRSLDWRSHEFQTLEGFPSLSATSNPMLGIRGTFSYLAYPEIFELELMALVEVYRAGYTNVRLILPFVRTVEEFSFCRLRVEQAGLNQYFQFQLWMMAEVPSVLLLLPDYVKAGVQGISIGTNDLTQLLLGVDRDQSEMASAFDERHPAVMRAVEQLIQTAKEQGISCSICGQAPAKYPDVIEQLVRWGIESISVSLDAVESSYVAIARAEQRIILQAARRNL